MKLTDEKLQEAIEAGMTDGEGDDDRAYRQVFAALRQPVRGGLSAGFEDAVVQKIVQQQVRRASREYLWYLGGILLLLLAAVITILYTGFRVNFGFLQGISAYAGVFIFGGAFILFLHVLDKRLLHNRRA